MEPKEIILRFGLVFTLTLIYGVYRQRSSKPVGFGTFILVASGSCGIAISASEIGTNISMPLIGAIITGIGFLGAGALIRTSDKIFGFTTATSIWIFAIFGTMLGLGYLKEGIIVYSIIWIVILIDRYLEKHHLGSHRRKIAITSKNFIEKEKITNIISKHSKGFHMISIDLDKKENHVTVNYLVEGIGKGIESLLKDLNKEEWCERVEIE